MSPSYQTHAICYGSARDRLSEQNFMFPPARGLKMPLDYYFWLIEGEGHTFWLTRPLPQTAASVAAGHWITTGSTRWRWTRCS